MLRLSTNARTVWVGDLKTESKVGADGQPYISKQILFRVASNRDYTVNKVVNGVTVKERPSDFIFCKATGSIAQAIADYASAKDATGKLVSRHLSLHGSLETYTTYKDMQINANVGGQVQAIQFKAEVEQTIFIVKELDFLDSSSKATIATPVTGGAVATTQPIISANQTVTQSQIVTQPVQSQIITQPVQSQIVQQPVQSQVPVTEVQQSLQSQVPATEVPVTPVPVTQVPVTEVPVTPVQVAQEAQTVAVDQASVTTTPVEIPTIDTTTTAVSGECPF